MPSARRKRFWKAGPQNPDLPRGFRDGFSPIGMPAIRGFRAVKNGFQRPSFVDPCPVP